MARTQTSAKDPDRSISIKLQSLERQLLEKDSQIATYESQLKTLFEDFNFNIELIYQRDREIESLTERNDDLSKMLSERDLELESQKKTIQKLKRLEAENISLQRKLERLTSDKDITKSTRAEPKFPSFQYKPNNRGLVNRRTPSLGCFKFLKEDIEWKDEELDNAEVEESFDLQSRIRVLESENIEKKNISDAVLTKSSEVVDSDVSGVREKVKKQEKEITDLIQSLQVYKNQSEEHYQLKNYSEQMNSLNKDIEKLRKRDQKFNRNKPFLRPKSSFDTRAGLNA